MKMTIEWSQWRIRSSDYCYIVERKINPTRWRAETYHNSLAQACQSLLDYRIRTETADCVIDATNRASIRLQSAQLLQKIDQIANEISQGLGDDTI